MKANKSKSEWIHSYRIHRLDFFEQRRQDWLLEDVKIHKKLVAFVKKIIETTDAIHYWWPL